jgi:hypothetical protein
MPIHICRTCGTSYPDAPEPPERCAICEEERQYVPKSGQAWTTPDALAAAHANAWRQREPGLFEIRTWPSFGIGQRAFLLCTPDGNILWDCIALIDDATEAIVRAMGGLRAIAISHPHYYTRMQDWAQAFDVPVYLHARDRAWVMRDDPRLVFWEAEQREIAPGATLLRLGGHFAGGTVLHWAGGAEGRGVLLAGDIVQVSPRAGHVSFLWSYPNRMPLSGRTVQRIAAALEGLRFDRIYGAFGLHVLKDGNDVVRRSAERYVELLEGEQA